MGVTPAIFARREPMFGTSAARPVFTFHGLVDEVRVYDRAITGAEASALYDCAR